MPFGGESFPDCNGVEQARTVTFLVTNAFRRGVLSGRKGGGHTAETLAAVTNAFRRGVLSGLAIPRPPFSFWRRVTNAFRRGVLSGHRHPS